MMELLKDSHILFSTESQYEPSLKKSPSPMFRIGFDYIFCPFFYFLSKLCSMIVESCSVRSFCTCPKYFLIYLLPVFLSPICIDVPSAHSMFCFWTNLIHYSYETLLLIRDENPALTIVVYLNVLLKK